MNNFLGVETRKIKIDLSNNHIIELLIHEILIDESFLKDKNKIEVYLLDCHCIIFLVDITDEENFNINKNLFNFISEFCSDDINFVFAFNKNDLNKKRKLTNLEINQFEDEKKGKFKKFEISIKNKQNVDKLIENIKDYFNNLSKNKLYYNKDITEHISGIESTLNIVLIGDTSVGKSQFFLRFFKNKFNKNFSSTIGMEREFLSLKKDNILYKVVINDTAGQERFKALPIKYYQNADGALLLFDLTKRNSFNNVQNWMTTLKENAGTKKVIYLIGNKIDLDDEREISYEEAHILADEYKIKYFEISCKTNINIEAVTFRLISDILKSFKKRKSFSIKNKKTKKKKFC